MKKLSNVQIATIIAVIAYIPWEIYVLQSIKTLPESEQYARMDLTVIYPLLLVLIAMSIFQFFSKEEKR